MAHAYTSRAVGSSDLSRSLALSGNRMPELAWQRYPKGSFREVALLEKQDVDAGPGIGHFRGP
jgi:hypothetical protein